MYMAKNQSLIKMLDEIRFRDKLNQQQVAERIHVSSQHLSDVKNGRFPLSDDLRNRLQEEFTYLRTDDSSDVTPVRQSELEEYETTKNGTKFYRREDGKIIMEVPVVPIAALGSPEDEFTKYINDYDNDTVTIVVDGVHHGKYVAFRVEGDSMDDGTRNSFERGDIVVVRELARDKWLPKLHIKTWPYWVIAFGNNVRIKEIIAQDETTGTITCHSLNPSPEYTDFTLSLDDIHRLFNVIKKKPKEVVFGA